MWEAVEESAILILIHTACNSPCNLPGLGYCALGPRITHPILIGSTLVRSAETELYDPVFY